MKVKHVHAPRALNSTGMKRQKSLRTVITDKLSRVKDTSIPIDDKECWNEKDDVKSQFVNKGLQAWEEGRKQWLKRDECSNGQAASRERSLSLLIALCFDRDDADTDCETDDEDGFFR